MSYCSDRGRGAARIKVLVPIETNNLISYIHRVTGTTVIGLSDVKLWPKITGKKAPRLLRGALSSAQYARGQI